MTARLTRVFAILALAGALLLTACAPGGATPEPEPEPTFEGVVGRDWAEIVTAGDTFTDVYRLDFGLGALWALRDDEGTDRLLTSTDAVTWTEVPLDPRLPEDLNTRATLYVDDTRLVVVHVPSEPYFIDNNAYVPWIASYDGTAWTFLGPEELGTPDVTAQDPYMITRPVAISSLGDDLVILIGAGIYSDMIAGGSTIPCACLAPLVVRADGTIDWQLVQGSALGDTESFGGRAAHLAEVDGGVLLVTSYLTPEGGTRFHEFFSADGLTWEDRTVPVDEPGLIYGIPDVARNETGWITAASVRDDAGEERPLLFQSPDGAAWRTVHELDEGDPVALVATDSAFFAFPSVERLGADGLTVYTSVDGVEWTSFPEAFADSVGSPPSVIDAVAIGDGVIALTRASYDPLWVSGQTPFTPAAAFVPDTDN